MFFNWWASRQSWWCCYKGRFILSAQRAATSLLQQVSTRFFFSLLTNLLETFFWYCGNSFSNVYLSYRFKSIEFRQKGLAQFNEIFTMLIRILFIFFFFFVSFDWDFDTHNRHFYFTFDKYCTQKNFLFVHKKKWFTSLFIYYF